MTKLVEDAIALACKAIAPTWPLNEFIAVNPYWGFGDRHIEDAAAQLSVLSGTTMLMNHEYYKGLWNQGLFNNEHIALAVDAAVKTGRLASANAPQVMQNLMADLDGSPISSVRPAMLCTSILDKTPHPERAMTWSETIVHQVSQHCAAFFDEHQAVWGFDEHEGLYATWRHQTSIDRALPVALNHRDFYREVKALPQLATSLIAQATDHLKIHPTNLPSFFIALLMDVNGWASWCAYQRWQAALKGGSDDCIIDLLATRLAWECLLHDNELSIQEKHDWQAVWSEPEVVAQASSKASDRQQNDWLLLNALEIAYQRSLCQQISTAAKPSEATDTAAVQAVFCIDVRSEPFRRAFEACSSKVQTIGFAGFFGLPIDYSPAGTQLVRPQLPGLLSAAHRITDLTDEPSLAQVLSARRKQNLAQRESFSRFKSSASSAFSFVESCGLAFAGKLMTDSLGIAPSQSAAAWEGTGLTSVEHQQLRPRFAHFDVQHVEMAAGILRAMGLTTNFARLVLLAGHGSHTTNNPHAAGLDCGACGGQTGEVNARVLANLLNDKSVRQGLAARQIVVPNSTWFIAGLHNTTTDYVGLFDTDLAPTTHTSDLQQLGDWLIGAAQRARAQRADSLGLSHLREQPRELKVAISYRARDWAQVRPEWGLVNNAAFIVAPRSRTKAIDLKGRSFLHDYAWQTDTEFKVLELIITAPMVVTNWINLQYYASTVDQKRYGSGNKVLHNVVGGSIGVFEGNGGDLRIGLPWQSLHDGRNLQHTPQRLSVFIEAPQAAIESIVERHSLVKNLVANQWLHLVQMESGLADSIRFSKYEGGLWNKIEAIK